MQQDKEILDRDRSNIFLRIISASFIGSLFIVSILWFQTLFAIIISTVGIVMFYEWLRMTRFSPSYALLGLIIIPPSIISLLIINANSYCYILLVYFILIWSVDTFAMAGGKIIKGPKLAPNISPNKTWSGFIVGIFASSAISSLIMNMVPIYLFFNTALFFVGTLMLASIAQVSDLFISYFKRRFNIKDSGNIIPGHGGMLDRFDSIVLTAPILCIYLVCDELKINTSADCKNILEYFYC